MIISNKPLLDDFCQKHAQAVKPLNRWIETVTAIVWEKHADLKQTYPSADYVGKVGTCLIFQATTLD